MKTVIFDFDKTLTKKDTLLPFAFYISKKRKQLMKFYVFLPYYLLFKFKIISNKTFKNVFLKKFFNGYSVETIKGIIQEFEKHFIKINLNSEIFSKFREYTQNRDRVIVLSSNFEILLKNISIIKDVEIIGSEVEYNKTSNTYRIKDNVCVGIEKIKKLKSVLGEKVFEEAVFYGDSEDKLLLKIFRNSIKV